MVFKNTIEQEICSCETSVKYWVKCKDFEMHTPILEVGDSFIPGFIRMLKNLSAFRRACVAYFLVK